MRVLISVAAWGRGYAATLARYSIASLLSPRNIPGLASEHTVTYHIVTTAADQEWLCKQPEIVRLEALCTIDWDLIESYGLDPRFAPVGVDGRKYPFLSQLQNLAFAKSDQHDAIVFNYADFVWADGSLANSIQMLRDDCSAILSFCLPVDLSAGKKALDIARRSGEPNLNLSPRQLAKIAIENLHREARARFWDAPRFTTWPTYIVWPVRPDGLLVRAYHQTVLVLRVRHDDPNFRLGILRGSLDGNFTAELAATGRTAHATDSDQVMVCSLYQTSFNTASRWVSREDALRKSLQCDVSKEQRHLAMVPLRVKAQFTDEAKWRDVERNSAELLDRMHSSTPFDAVAYERTQVDVREIVGSLRTSGMLERAYRRLATRIAHSALAPFIRRVMGPAARKLRLAIEQRIFRDKD